MDDKEAHEDNAKAKLVDAGATGEIFCVSALTGYGIPELREFLLTGTF
jgi:ethanolamine utilization protein EutP (predicted NTPase)